MKTYHVLIRVIMLLIPAPALKAQSGVNISPLPIPSNPGAILNVQSANQGVLLPRTVTSSVANPSDGLIVYDTVQHMYMYYDQSQWTALLKASSFQFFYADRDGDGYGDKYGAVYSMSVPMGYVSNDDDCDDLDPDQSPLEMEVCDSIDNNCNGLIDENCPNLGSPCDGPDEDLCADGIEICGPNGECLCNDDANSIPEICNGLDDDCDGMIDEDCVVTIDWGNLQFPSSIEMSAGNTPDIFGQVYAFGVTEPPGQGAGIIAQVGFGPDGSDPSLGGWTWVTATYNVDVMNNDEYKGVLTVTTPGSYDYAYRYSGDNGLTWLYGDLGDGSSNGYSPADAGHLVVD